MKPLRTLRNAMFAADVTQADVAKQIGRSKQYVSDRMTGKASFPIVYCYQILELIGAEPEEIFEMFPPEPPKRIRRTA